MSISASPPPAPNLPLFNRLRNKSEEDYLAWAKPLVDEARAGIARGEAMSLTERKARMNALLEIYGGFRSEEGAKDFAVTRSVLSTARKQGWDILATLIRDPDRLLTQLSVG